MAFPEDPIEELVLGETPTLLETEKGNELIRVLNRLRNISIDQANGKVTWTDDGVVLSWKEYSLPAGKLTTQLLDATDVSKKWVITYEDGKLQTVTYEDSEWEELAVEICVDGSAVTRTFLVKTIP